MAGPQERYDVFMNNYTERTWTLVTINAAIRELMQTYVKYPPRKLQSETYTGPITLTQYQRLQNVRDQLEKQGFRIGLPSGSSPRAAVVPIGGCSSSFDYEVHNEHRRARCHPSTSRSFLDRCFDCRCDPVHKGAGMGARRSAPIME